MSVAVAPSLSVPLKTDADNVIRVGGTRVSLDTIIFAYNEGSDAEDIVDQFDSLKLADVHAVISYYLQNRNEVEAYLEERKKFREQVRQMIEVRSDQTGIRERLLARELAKAI
ncbi:MAG: DUF433 domain-containing protein [Acidobacteriota bacterium]